jgi:hypothetical protein
VRMTNVPNLRGRRAHEDNRAVRLLRRWSRGQILIDDWGRRLWPGP